MAALDPEQRIHEQIYERLLDLLATPLKDGEEERDRLGRMQEFHSRKQREIAAIRKERSAAEATARVQALEQELAASYDPN